MIARKLLKPQIGGAYIPVRLWVSPFSPFKAWKSALSRVYTRATCCLLPGNMLPWCKRGFNVATFARTSNMLQATSNMLPVSRQHNYYVSLCNRQATNWQQATLLVMVVTRFQDFLRLKCIKSSFGWHFTPDPAG